MKLILFLILFIVIVLYHTDILQQFFKSKNKVVDPPKNKVVEEVGQPIYLLTVSDYTTWITTFHAYMYDELVHWWNGYSTQTLPQGISWQQALTQTIIDTYLDLYKITYTVATLPPLSMTFKNSLPTLPVLLSFNDIYPQNKILNNFIPDVPPSLSLYSYKPVDLKSSFYIKNSARVKTLKDCIDLAISLSSGQLYVNSDIINALESKKNDYINTIMTTKLDYFIRPVQYTYFDPLDLYLHPTRYTLNMGVGIMDSTQPAFTIFVAKNQLASLDRLLTVSHIDTPMIHTFFDLPNYMVEWDDDWKKQLFSTYYTVKKTQSTTQAFQQAISDTVYNVTNTPDSKNIINIQFDYTKASSYFISLPSTFYWIITLLSLFNPTADDATNILLLQRLVNASYNPQGCYNYCDSEQKVCDNEAQLLVGICDGECDGSETSCISNCDINLNNNINECSLDNTTCKTMCLSNDNLPSNCLSDSDCPNKACGRITASSYEPDICCPSNKKDTFWANDYCTGMTTGSECWTDDMCESGYCKGSVWPFAIKGNCSTN